MEIQQEVEKESLNVLDLSLVTEHCLPSLIDINKNLKDQVMQLLNEISKGENIPLEKLISYYDKLNPKLPDNKKSSKKDKNKSAKLNSDDISNITAPRDGQCNAIVQGKNKEKKICSRKSKIEDYCLTHHRTRPYGSYKDL